MNADDRHAQILDEARRVLARGGMSQFSLEEVAREAGVAATLPRHYFGSRDGLLAAAVADLAAQITEPFTDLEAAVPSEQRIERALSHVVDNEWIRAVWVRAPSLHPEIDTRVREAACLMAEISFGRRWSAMTPLEQFHASGWVGFAVSTVSHWLDGESPEIGPLLDALIDGAGRLGVGVA